MTICIPYELTSFIFWLVAISSFAILMIAAALFSMSSFVVIHDDTLIRMAVVAFHTVPPHQQVPSSCTFLMMRFVRWGSPNETSTWLSVTLFKILKPACSSFDANNSANEQQRSI